MNVSPPFGDFGMKLGKTIAGRHFGFSNGVWQKLWRRRL